MADDESAGGAEVSQPQGNAGSSSLCVVAASVARPSSVPRRWWHGRLAFLKSISWPGMASAFVALALLLAFGQVVSKAVQVGESRQRAAAAQFDATWRCQMLSDRLLRQDCLAQLDKLSPAGNPSQGRAGIPPGR